MSKTMAPLPVPWMLTQQYSWLMVAALSLWGCCGMYTIQCCMWVELATSGDYSSESYHSSVENIFCRFAFQYLRDFNKLMVIFNDLVSKRGIFYSGIFSCCLLNCKCLAVTAGFQTWSLMWLSVVSLLFLQCLLSIGVTPLMFSVITKYTENVSN